jgi:uncharacterized protein (TIGR02246 family)
VDDDNSRNAEIAIAEARAAFVAALSDGDTTAVARMYADDARLVAPSAELVEGREAIEAFWRAGLEVGVRELELDAIDLDRTGCVAYEVGTYVLRVESEGGPVVDSGKYVLVHKRQHDGAWLRAVETFNPDAPPVTAGGRGKGRGGER